MRYITLAIAASIILTLNLGATSLDSFKCILLTNAQSNAYGHAVMGACLLGKKAAVAGEIVGIIVPSKTDRVNIHFNMFRYPDGKIIPISAEACSGSDHARGILGTIMRPSFLLGFFRKQYTVADAGSQFHLEPPAL